MSEKSETISSGDVSSDVASPETDTGESVEGSNVAVNTPALQAKLNEITAASPALLMAQEALIDALAPGNPESVGWVLDLPTRDLADLLRNMRLCAIDFAKDIYEEKMKAVEEIRRTSSLRLRNALGTHSPDINSVLLLDINPLCAFEEEGQRAIYRRIAQYVCSGHPNFGASNVLAGSQDASHPQYPNPLSVPENAFRLGKEFQWFDTGSIRHGEFPRSLSPFVLPTAYFLQKEHGGNCNRNVERDFIWYHAVLVRTCLVALEQLPSLTEEENEIFDTALRRYLEGKNASSTVDTSWRAYLEKYARMQKEFDRIVNLLESTPQQDGEPSVTPIPAPEATKERSTGQNTLPDFQDLKTFILYAMKFIQHLSIITRVHEKCRGQWSEESVRTVKESQGNPSGDKKGLDEIIDAVLEVLPDRYTEALTAMQRFCDVRDKVKAQQVPQAAEGVSEPSTLLLQDIALLATVFAEHGNQWDDSAVLLLGSTFDSMRKHPDRYLGRTRLDAENNDIISKILTTLPPHDGKAYLALVTFLEEHARTSTRTSS